MLAIGLAMLAQSASAAPACIAGFRAAAEQALVDFAADADVSIASTQMAAVLDEVADKACAKAAELGITVPDGVAAKIIDEYFTAVLANRRPPAVGGIVSEVMEGRQGLVRRDARNFGSLKVDCATSIADPRVWIGNQELGVCGDTFLADAGAISVQVKSGAATTCAMPVDVRPRKAAVCGCDPAVGLALTCQ
jgi:hypothetical protein